LVVVKDNYWVVMVETKVDLMGVMKDEQKDILLVALG
jgi:uncharacterized membrane protein YqjE